MQKNTLYSFLVSVQYALCVVKHAVQTRAYTCADASRIPICMHARYPSLSRGARGMYKSI